MASTHMQQCSALQGGGGEGGWRGGENLPGRIVLVLVCKTVTSYTNDSNHRVFYCTSLWLGMLQHRL